MPTFYFFNYFKAQLNVVYLKNKQTITISQYGKQIKAKLNDVYEKERKKETSKQKTLLSIKLNKTESSLYQKGCLVKTFKQTNKKTISQCVKKNTHLKHKSKTKLNEIYVNKQTIYQSGKKINKGVLLLF